MNCIHINNYIKLGFLALIIAALSSCAAMFSGANQNIKVKSEPSGAEVYINGQNTYKHTPCKVIVKRRQKPSDINKRNELNIEVRKDGYETSNLHTQSSFNIISGGSILMGGFPFIIDWAAGAHRKYPKSNFLYLQATTYDDIDPQIIQETTTPKKTILSYTFKSDIDFDIPDTKRYYPKRFALIVGNEDYASHQDDLDEKANVKYAKSDAESFKTYAINTLGIPEENITFLPNATLAKMKQGVTKLKLLAKNSYGEAELFFYYAGHGLPNEETKEPYLIPVDVSGKNLELAISLDETLREIAEYETKKVTCFIDCCFSGGSRVGDLYESRGVRIVPKDPSIKGNMVVFTASSSDQSALAYDEQKHGLFTYFLLKKFKESNGNVTYGDLHDYLKKNLPLQSILINEKEQLPQINVGSNIDINWKNWEF